MPGVNRTLTFTVDDEGKFTYTKTPSNIPPNDDADTFTYGRADRVRFQTQKGPFRVTLRLESEEEPTVLPWKDADQPLASGEEQEGPSRMFRTPVQVVATPPDDSPRPVARYSYLIEAIDGTFRDDLAEGDFES